MGLAIFNMNIRNCLLGLIGCGAIVIVTLIIIIFVLALILMIKLLAEQLKEDHKAEKRRILNERISKNIK